MDHPQAVLDYYARVGAEVLNFRRAIIKIKRHGAYYVEKATIKIHDDGTVTCSSKDDAPTEQEALMMKGALAGMNFPRSAPARDIDDLKSKLGKNEYHVFYDRRTGMIRMVQERRMNPDGTKAYIPWAFMDDDTWQPMEPDGPLPFWKAMKTRGATRIMIHEGAKAASYAERIVREDIDHPWRKELELYDHWGMIGGALAPHRADWAELKAALPVKLVYVCDNDQPGLSALPKVAKAWGKVLAGVRFGDDFPEGWDIADELPKKLFSDTGRWLGHSIQYYMVPATWATEPVVAEGKSKAGRTAHTIRTEFAEEWLHCVQPEVFVHRDWPHTQFNVNEFNNAVAPFSDVDDTARLLRKQFASKAVMLTYDPGNKPGVYKDETGVFINTYKPSPIVGEKGDVAMWLDFMEQLVVNEADRKLLMQWVATLVARPDVRMLYGVLLISETQGVGKGTLGEKILAPLVGLVNTSLPSEQEIVDSNFNYWLAHKRLAVVHEIYAGQSFKAYNKLKSLMTDKYVTVSKKYQANYQVQNWIHVLACSNSMRALKLSNDDRRWFVPQLTDRKRPLSWWTDFNRWLSMEGGLQLIAGWAREFVAEHGAVSAGAPAPWSSLKKEMVEEAYSPGMTVAARALDQIAEMVAEGKLAEEVFVMDTAVVELIKREIYEGRHNDRLERPMTIRNLAKSKGWFVGRTRANVREWNGAAAGGRVLSLSAAVAARSPGELGGTGVKDGERRSPLDLGVVLTL